MWTIYPTSQWNITFQCYTHFPRVSLQLIIRCETPHQKRFMNNSIFVTVLLKYTLKRGEIITSPKKTLPNILKLERRITVDDSPQI